MVRDAGHAADRGQLILVGAIAIAVVLIGLTLVLNSAVFTENIAEGASRDVTQDVAQFDREAVRNVRSLTIRINHGQRYHTNEDDELEDHVARNVTNYSRVLGETYADTGSVYVNVTYLETRELGSRILQGDDGDLARNDGQPSWTPVDGTTQIGWFVMNVDVQNVSQTDPFYVNVTDAGGTELSVSLRRTGGNQLAVNSTVGGGNVSEVTCRPQNGRVLLDVLDGTTYTGDCSFNSTGYLEPPYTQVEIGHGDLGRGKYDLVVENASAVSSGMPACPSGKSCEALAAWSVAVTTHYQTGSVDYSRTHNVSVYAR